MRNRSMPFPKKFRTIKRAWILYLLLGVSSLILIFMGNSYNIDPGNQQFQGDKASRVLVEDNVVKRKLSTERGDTVPPFIFNASNASNKEKARVQEVKGGESSKRIPLFVAATRNHHGGPLSARFPLRRCSHKCRFSNDISLAASADVIVVQVITMNGSRLPEVREGQHSYGDRLTCRTNIKSRLILQTCKLLSGILYTETVHDLLLYTRESPGRHNGFQRHWTEVSMGYFDMTMTYLRNSDYWDPYSRLVPIEKDEEQQWSDKQVSDALARKSSASFSLISHCKADSARDEFLDELAKYHPFERYGRCDNNSCGGKCVQKLIASNHFYLALENTVCADYITEKFFRFDQLIVPITFTRSVISGLVPDDVFIAVDDFCSVKELADYLDWLMRNPEEYKRYFSWTKKYRVELGEPPICSLCRDLHLGAVNTTDYTHMKDIWAYMPASSCEDKYGLTMIENRCTANFTSGNPLLVHYSK